MPNFEGKSKDYQLGYTSGYKAGLRKRSEAAPTRARWVWNPKTGEWHCSSCFTQFDQAHDNYCCKCGKKMSEESVIDENN